MKLTKKSTMATRKWFADNALACIEEVKSGQVKVNDQARYFDKCERDCLDALAGKYDHTFAFRQRAIFIQTGECLPLFKA